MLTALVSIFLLFPNAKADTLSASGIETEYNYTVSFRSLARVAHGEYPAEVLAQFHAGHVYGLFHSPLYATKFGFYEDLNEGFAGTKTPEIIEAKLVKKDNDPYWWVEYAARGHAVVLTSVFQAWKQVGEERRVLLPWLQDLPAIYNDSFTDYRASKWKKCTDKEYPGVLDFSYFFDPFRCADLGRPPVGQAVEFRFRAVKKEKWRTQFPRRELHGDNGNGPLVTMYFALGFDAAHRAGTPQSKIKKDDGYRIYTSFSNELTKDFGFEEITSVSHLRETLGSDSAYLQLDSPVSMDHFSQRRFYKTFVKKSEGKIFVVRLGLFDSQNQGSDRPLRSFPVFWREAWKNGDLVYYGGHSGDGVVLNEGELLRTLSMDDLLPVKNSRKTQIGFLDACSTYAYYQDMYRQLKPTGLHLMTYGVVSLYHAAQVTMTKMVENLLSPSMDADWVDVLAELEASQLEPHYQYLYGREDGAHFAEQNRRKGLFPSFLLNVWVP